MFRTMTTADGPSGEKRVVYSPMVRRWRRRRWLETINVRTRWRRDARRSTFLSACLGVTGRQSGFPLSNRIDFFTFYSSLDHGFHFIRRGNGEPWSRGDVRTRRCWSSDDETAQLRRIWIEHDPRNASLLWGLRCISNYMLVDEDCERRK